MNNVCLFIDHLINEYIQDCDEKAVSLNETKIWNEIQIPIWTIQVQNRIYIGEMEHRNSSVVFSLC